MIRNALLAAVAAVALSACSTSVKETPAPGMSAAPAATAVRVVNVSGTTTAAKVPAGTDAALAEAIRIEVAKGSQTGPAANLTFVISDYRVVSNAARFMVGALAGSNRMTVDVTLKTPEGQTLRTFQVTRAANTMGVGAFMNQKGSLVSQTAEAVGKAVRGEKP